MLSISLFTIVFFLADLAWCSSKFLRPPEWDDNVDTIGDMGNNVQFKDGDTVQFRWETDLDDFQLIIVQVLDDREIFGKFQSLGDGWKARWNATGTQTDKEDSVYWFGIFEPGEIEKPIASTQYVNVSAPKGDETKTVTSFETATIIQTLPSTDAKASTTQPASVATVTPQVSSEKAGRVDGHSSGSGMSQGQIAGAAVGGTIGSLLLLGACGWFMWRRSKRKEVDGASDNAHCQQQASDPRAELPGDMKVGADSTVYASSPPGLHEAP